MIIDYRNKHHGETCLIIGNGPSLCKVPRDFLTRYPTFGQNAIYLMDGFTPTYYVATDPRNLDPDKIHGVKCPKFIRRDMGFDVYNTFTLTREHVFSLHPDKYVYEGYSVTFVSLQLAYYMGFSTVLLVGVDFRYKPYDASKEADPNHFTPVYGGVTDWSPHSLEKGRIGIIDSMTLADEAYRKDGRRVINLTEGTALQVFELGTVEEWMK